MKSSNDNVGNNKQIPLKTWLSLQSLVPHYGKLLVFPCTTE